MSVTVRATHLGGDRFEICVRQHRLEADQPVDDGGEDLAPTPTELFVSSLAACVAFYIRRFLDRHGLSTEGLAVDASFTMAHRPARVGEIILHLELPVDIPQEKRDALMAVASHCTVHNTLRSPPKIMMDFASPHNAAA
jgi:putative redox protein